MNENSNFDGPIGMDFRAIFGIDLLYLGNIIVNKLNILRNDVYDQ